MEHSMVATDKALARWKYKSAYDINYTRLSQEDTCRLINKWLIKKGYDRVFRQDIRCILQENRRTTRKSNVKRWGVIPFRRSVHGKVYYDYGIIKSFIKDRLEPYCRELETQRLDLARKAGFTYAP